MARQNPQGLTGALARLETVVAAAKFRARFNQQPSPAGRLTEAAGRAIGITLAEAQTMLEIAPNPRRRSATGRRLAFGQDDDPLQLRGHRQARSGREIPLTPAVLPESILDLVGVQAWDRVNLLHL